MPSAQAPCRRRPERQENGRKFLLLFSKRRLFFFKKNNQKTFPRLVFSQAARVAVTGWVQKVSNLILNIKPVAGRVDIRGNSGQPWTRGSAYLPCNRLLASAP